MSKERLLNINRFNIHNNGYINHENGKLVLYSDVYDKLRDETAGANIEIYANPEPDGNESSNYLVITSDKFNLCITEDMIEDCAVRFHNKPWVAKPKPAPKKRKAKKKVAKVESEKTTRAEASNRK
jgi:hypothetical protein